MNPLDLLKGFGNYLIGAAGKRDALIQYIMSNPEYALQLQQNPQLIRKFVGGFGDIGDRTVRDVANANIPADARFAFNEANRAASLQTLATKPSAIADASTKLPSLTMDDYSQLLAQAQSNNGKGTLSPELQEQYDALRSGKYVAKINREATKASTENVKLSTQLANEQRNRIEVARPIAKQEVARLGFNNLGAAALGMYGKSFKDEQTGRAIYTIPEYKQAIDDQKQLLLEKERQRFIALGDTEGQKRILARRIVEKGMDAGILQGTEYPLAMELINNPMLANELSKKKPDEITPEQEPLYKVANAYKVFNEKEGRVVFNQALSMFTRLAPRFSAGKQIVADESLANEYNKAMELSFAPSGIEPAKFVLGHVDVPHGGDTPVILRIGGDKRFVFKNPPKSYIEQDGQRIYLNADGEPANLNKSVGLKAEFPNISDDVLSQAQAAIDKGADPNKVKERLRSLNKR